MGRLIDGNDVIQAIRKLPVGSAMQKIRTMDAVEHIPTAYDPDKVIEQMQALSDKADDDIAVCEADMCQYYDGYGDGLDRAVEIVKRGGRDEEYE